MSLTLLSATDVKQCIDMRQAIDAMESAFLQLARNQVVLPLRTPITIESENAVCLTMPAYLKEEKQLGLKVVSLFPNNHLQKLPAINGVILLLDAQTGKPKAIMDATWLTALRTGAVSGLATRLLAKDDAKHVTIIGAGAQAITQLEAVASVRNIQQVSVWSRTHAHAISFAKQIEQRFEVHACTTVLEAVKDADIICTATNSTEPLIHLADIKHDAHINAIGSHTKTMHEIAPDVFTHAVTVVDQIDAALKEAGEIICAIESSVIDLPSLHELGYLLTHQQPEFKNQLTVFKSVGLAIQDISIAEMAYRNAIDKKIGHNFDLS